MLQRLRRVSRNSRFFVSGLRVVACGFQLNAVAYCRPATKTVSDQCSRRRLTRSCIDDLSWPAVTCVSMTNCRNKLLRSLLLERFVCDNFLYISISNVLWAILLILSYRGVAFLCVLLCLICLCLENIFIASVD